MAALEVFATYAEATAALPGLSDGTYVEVMADENNGGARTRYRVEVAALVFQINLDQLRADLGDDSNSKGAAIVANALIRISNVTELRSMNQPTRPTLVVLDEYGGEAVAGDGMFRWISSGTKVDDGGMFFRVDNSGGWERMSTEVDVDFYGIVYSDKSVSTTLTFQTEKLQAAIDFARENNLPLRINHPLRGGGPYEQVGIAIDNTIDMSGLYELRGSLVLLTDSNFSGTPDLEGNIYALRIQNATYDSVGQFFGTTKPSGQFGEILIINASRDYELNGALITTAHASFIKIVAARFNGWGVHLASAYDNTFLNIHSFYCGNKNRYAFDSTGYKAASGSQSDETNSNVIVNLITHDSYERSWRISGSKNNVAHIHDERTLVTIEANPQAIGDNVSLERLNCAFQSQYGNLGQASLDPHPDSLFDQICAIITIQNTVSNLFCSDSAKVIISNGYLSSQVYGCNVQKLHAPKIEIKSNAGVQIGTVICDELTTDASMGKKSQIYGGVIGSVVNSFVDMYGVRINGLTSVSGVAGTYTGCRLYGDVTLTLRNIFNDCYISQQITVNDGFSSDFYKCTFNGGVVGLGVGLIRMQSCILSSLQISSGYGGAVIIDQNSRVTGNSYSWQPPAQHPSLTAGEVTVNSRATAGTIFEYVYSSSGWGALSMMP